MSRHTHIQRHIIYTKCFWSYISSAYLPAEESRRIPRPAMLRGGRDPTSCDAEQASRRAGACISCAVQVREAYGVHARRWKEDNLLLLSNF